MAISLPIVSEWNPTGLNKAIADFKKLEGAGAKAAFVIKKAALPATAALGGLAVVGAKAVDAASDLVESQTKVGVIFGESAASVEKFAETAAQSFGQSKQEVLNAAGSFGTFGKAAGLGGQDLADFSNDFTALASDLASFNNTTPQEAIEAIGAALRGESEPIRKYGVLLNDAALKAEAFALGISDGKAPLTAQEKILAAQSAIMKQTTAAQGDFARTSGGLANQQRILKANMANTTAAIGQAFLPIIEKLLPKLQSMANFVRENTGLIVTIGVVIGTLAAAILAVNAGLAVYNTIQALTAALNTALTASFSALWVATGAILIIGIIAAIVALQAKFDIFGTIISGLKKAFEVWWAYVQFVFNGIAQISVRIFNTVRTVVREFVDVVKNYIGSIFNAFKTVFNGVASLWNNTIGKLSFKVPSWVPVIGGKGFSVPNIPLLAQGGIVTGPTLAMIGEAGPEAVIPLDRAGMMGGNNITINMPVGSNGDDVVRALQRYARFNGNVPVATTTAVRR